MTDLAALGLEELARGIRDGAFSSHDATAAALKRIAEWQPHINAFIRIDAVEALETARERDRERERGYVRGPLHGVPLAHKDLFARTGRVTTGGSAILRETPADVTATAFARMEAAGAVDLGTLHMSEFAVGPTGHNVHFGHCRNPHDPSRITGGSSSGSAAAVAARLVPATLGTDTGASVRVPACCCGVVGLKPTYGRVSRYGVLPRSWSLDHVGPLARSARDCAVLLGVVAGHDPHDASTSRRGVPDFAAAAARSPVRGLRVGVPGERILAEIDGEVADALTGSLDVLKSLGATLREVPMPSLDDLMALGDTIIGSEAASIHRHWLAERPQDYAHQVRVRVERGRSVTAADYLDALRLRGVHLSAFLTTTMAEVDVLHMPVMPFPVPTIEETDVEAEDREAVFELVRRLTTFTRPFNLLGVPAVSVPCGTCRQGLPLAFQAVGHPFAEGTLLALAAAYEAEVGPLPSPALPS